MSLQLTFSADGRKNFKHHVANQTQVIIPKLKIDQLATIILHSAPDASLQSLRVVSSSQFRTLITM